MKRFDPLTLLVVLASMAGFVFAAVSTSDFVAHLDRQVHGIHCSFLPGLAAADQTGESGCHVTLMSPYSSVFRESVWGGIPIALPAMAVFAFLAFLSIWLAINGHARQKQATGFLVLATLVPVGASAVMGYLSFSELGAACKLCIGIYISSAVAFVAALVQWMLSEDTAFVGSAQKGPPPPADGERRSRLGSAVDGTAPLPASTLAMAFAAGVVFVLVPVAAYAAKAPDFSTYVGSCGSLPHPNHDPSALISFGAQKGRTQLLEVFDPLCPSCKAFEDRFGKMEVASEVDRKFLLFPLDESCNWMIDRSIHPGACSVSEAVLCADQPDAVIDWAFSHQKEIMAAAQKDPKAAARMVTAKFPALANCVGGAEVQARLNSSLRWAVKNQLQVLTPQVFVNGLRLCGEDTDLGLDYALPRLIKRAETQVRPVEQTRDAEGEDEAPADGTAARPGAAATPSGTSKVMEERAKRAREEAEGTEPDAAEAAAPVVEPKKDTAEPKKDEAAAEERSPAPEKASGSSENTAAAPDTTSPTSQPSPTPPAPTPPAPTPPAPAPAAAPETTE